jgi:hypothetical protein
VVDSHRTKVLNPDIVEDVVTRATIATSGSLPSILEALKAREEQLADVNAQLEHLDGMSRAAVTWGDDLRGEIRARLPIGTGSSGASRSWPGRFSASCSWAGS